MSVVCHYMMHPRGKIQSPSCPPVAAADPLQRNCAVSSRPAVTVRCIKQTHPSFGPMISPPHDTCETPRASSHTFIPWIPPLLLALTIKHTGVSIDPTINHKFTAWRDSFLCSQPRSGTPAPWSQRVPWIHIQTCGVSPILVRPFL